MPEWLDRALFGILVSPCCLVLLGMHCWGHGSVLDPDLDRGNWCHRGHRELGRGSKQSKRRALLVEAEWHRF
jgi:hypothetical protein